MADVAALGRREQTKSQNRQAILDAGRAVFAELGYDAVTVRDIIRRTGLASGTFYNYFRSKEEVFAALADDGARRFAPVIKQLREQAIGFEGFVRAAISAYFEFIAEERRLWLEGRPAGESARVLPRETPEMQAVFGEVRQAIQAAAGGPGGVPDADPDYMAAACIAIARDIGDVMTTRRPPDIAGAAEFASAMILNGLRGLPQRHDA
jgi:AcrR family transcriptional regulator